MAANLSPETQAIIDRLKAEGDLIRNSGTNSLRAVRTEFAKFDGVFNSINANISEQTEIMRAQLNLDQEALVKSRTQEQFDEVSPGSTSGSSSSPSRSSDDGDGGKTDEAINNMGDKIAEGFSLKNLAMVAAAGFLGYNFIKGFISQAMGDNLFGMNDFVTDVKSIDIKGAQDTFTGMGESLTSIKESMNSLATSIASLNEAIESITSISWMDIATTVLTSIGALQAYNLTMRMALRMMGNGPGLRPGGPGGGGGRRGLFKRLLAGGITIATLGGIFGRGAQADIDGAQTDLDRDRNGGTDPNDPRGKNQINTDGNRPVVDRPPVVTTTSPVQPDAPNINIETSGNTTRYRDGASGRYIPADEAIPRLSAAGLNAQGLPNVDTTTPRPPATGGGRGNGQAEVDQRRAGADLGKRVADENRSLIKRLAKSKIGKVVAMAIPGVGLFAGLGFGIWNIVQGDFTSAALQLGSIPLPSVSGTALDLSSIGTEIFFAVSGETYNPSNPAHNSLMKEIGIEIHAAYQEFMSEQEENVKSNTDRRELYDNQAVNDLAAAERLQMGGARAFSDSGYNPEIANRSLGSNYHTGANVTLGSSSAFTGNYWTDRNGIVMYQDRNGNVMRASDRPNISTVEGAGSGSAAPVVIAPTTNNAPVQVTQGGNTAKQTTVQVMGGSFGESNGFGMTSGLVQG